MKLNSVPAQRITSSASREKWMANSAAAAENSMRKSRSLTPSMEFCVSWTSPPSFTKPSNLATNSRLSGSVLPAIALQHFNVGEQMMREIDGLRALQMRIAGNNDPGVLLAERNQGTLQSGD